MKAMWALFGCALMFFLGVAIFEGGFEEGATPQMGFYVGLAMNVILSMSMMCLYRANVESSHDTWGVPVLGPTLGTLSLLAGVIFSAGDITLLKDARMEAVLSGVVAGALFLGVAQMLLQRWQRRRRTSSSDQGSNC